MMRKVKITRIVVMALLTMCTAIASHAAVEVNLKWGKPTQEELEMTQYAPDSEAPAVILCRQTEVHYDFIGQDLKEIITEKCRIKILNNDGKRYAEGHAIYNSRNGHDIVTKIKGTTFNLVGGKVEKTKLDNSMITFEEATNKLRVMKFTMPRVEVGSVLEYEYVIESDNYLSVRDWEPMDDIPVAYADYEITFPQWFEFNLDMTGHNPVETKESSRNLAFSGRGSTLRCTGTTYQFICRELPAVKDEPLSYSSRFYTTCVAFNIRSVVITGVYSKYYSTDWNTVCKMLAEDEDFGGRYKSNPLRKEMKQAGIYDIEDRSQRILAIVDLLRSKVKWNGDYTLYGRSAGKVLKDGTGSNSDINFILIAMLNDAGIKALPAVLRQRTRGLWPMNRPSLSHISTTVVIIPDGDGGEQFHCLDGSREYVGLDVLPSTFRVPYSVGVDGDGAAGWYNLEDRGIDQRRVIITGSLDDTGLLTATRLAGYSNAAAEEFRIKYHHATDSAHFVADLEREAGIEVEQYTCEGLNDVNAAVKETMTFTRQCDATGDHIYLNQLLFPLLADSPLKSETRLFPIEFPGRSNITIATRITIPQGWQVEELPRSFTFTTEDGAMAVRIMSTSTEDNTVEVNVRMTNSRLLYAPDEYPVLKEMLGEIVKRGGDLIVLSKKP